MSNYITSTMTGGVNYAIYEQLPGNSVKVKKTIHINGGANLVNPRTLATPSGAATAISDTDLALLENHPLFKLHKEKGYVKVIKSVNKFEAEAKAEKAEGLEEKDSSAQKTASDYKKQGRRSPRTSKE